VTDRPLHVDFMRVGVGARIVVAVPIQVIDSEKSPGIKRGGLVNVVRHEIELYCNADAIPEKLVVSLDGCDIGDSVHISHVALPEGTKPVITGRDFTVVTVAAPTVVREELAAAQAAAQAAQAAAEAAAAAGETLAAPAEGGTAAPTAGTATPAAAAPAAGAAAAAPAKGGPPARGGAPAKG
jgi:large subunit ribosomal protein L25